MTSRALNPLPTWQAARLLPLPITLGSHGLQLVGRSGADPSLRAAAQWLHERLTS